MRQQRDSTLDTSRQLCLSYIYRLDWTSTSFDGTMHEYTISAGDGEALKLHSVIFRICPEYTIHKFIIISMYGAY